MQNRTPIRSTAFLLALIALSALVAVAAAHEIEVVKSTPADREVLEESPTQVIIQFNYELNGDESTLKVFDANGNQVDNGDIGLDLYDPDHATLVVSLPPLQDGVYTVQWHAVILDEDEGDGAFLFSVGVEIPENQSGPVTTQTPPPEESEASLPMGWIVAVGAIVVTLLALLIFSLSRRPPPSS